MKISLVLAAAVATLALSTTALAQAPTSAPAKGAPVAATAPAAPAASAPITTTTSEYTEQRTEGNQVVTFGGDALVGDPQSAYGFTIRRPPGILRAGLIRPRVNFVAELLKSVENL